MEPSCTKNSALIRHIPIIRAAGAKVPYSLLVQPPLDTESARRLLGSFKHICGPDKLYPPCLMVRNNGKPTGTGVGKSVPFILDDSPQGPRRFQEILGSVQSSDPESQGVIIQPFVGQMLGENIVDGKLYGPILSGIAYTPACTESGNAIVEWVWGHPALAVGGEGRYSAFNRRNLEAEISEQAKYVWNGNNTIMLLISGRSKIERECPDNLETITNLDDGQVRQLFEKIFGTVLKIGEEGPKYLEWAITVQKSMRLFILQISDFTAKLAGHATNVYEALTPEKIRYLMKEEGAGGQDLGGLRERYNRAVQDQQVIAVGFGVAGKDRKEFDTVIWRPNKFSDVAGLVNFSTLLVWSSYYAGGIKPLIGEMEDYDAMAGGIVEWNRETRPSNTFQGHAGGYCREHNILGLGGALQTMQDRLYALFPKGAYGEYPSGTLIIRGKFILEVDASIPFGTLKALEVSEVRELE